MCSEVFSLCFIVTFAKVMGLKKILYHCQQIVKLSLVR